MNLKEIAKACNVSQATVSLVLNNKKGVSEEKRRQVAGLLSANGYKVNEENIAGQSVKNSIRLLKIKKHSKLIEENPGFITDIIDSIERECRKKRFNLIVSNCELSNISEFIRFVNENPTDGLLILGTEFNEQDSFEFVKDISIPFVVIDNSIPRKGISCITMNNQDAIFLSVEYLVSLGHKNIGFLANNMPSSNCNARLRGFITALKMYNIREANSYVFEVAPTTSGSYQSIKELLEKGTKFPSALVANNDSIALGAIKAFKEFGISIPQNISIVGFDNINFSTLSDPPLTTNDVPKRDIGKWAVTMLRQKIYHPNSSAVKIYADTTLVIRESTCKYNSSLNNKYVLK